VIDDETTMTGEEEGDYDHTDFDYKWPCKKCGEPVTILTGEEKDAICSTCVIGDIVD
jgi:hypothetical protein